MENVYFYNEKEVSEAEWFKILKKASQTKKKDRKED